MIADYDGDISNLLNTEITGEIPVLTTRNLIVFPGIVTPILVGRESSVQLVKYLDKHSDAVCAIVCQRDSNVDNPTYTDVYHTGVYGKLVKLIDMPGPGGNFTAIVQALGRCHLTSLNKGKKFYLGEVTPYADQMPMPNKEFNALYETVKKSASNYISLNDEMPDEAQYALSSIRHSVIGINYICCNLPLPIKNKIKLLEKDDISERAFSLLKALEREIQLLKLKQDIQQKTRMDLDEQQREYFLQQQIKNIKEELGHGEGSPEVKELREKASEKKWNDNVAVIFERELDKLELYNPQSPEYSVQLNYLQNMVNLPWGIYTKDDLNIKKAIKILDRDHYGMEKVKERILEYISVLKRRGDLKSPILCLYGPPGVGKTSLGRSIADAMNRKYVRVSLGGVHDEAEIRGHRRTYIGAMPGRIIKSIQKAEASNPVFILDEIDKVTQNTINGDPSSALLEVLDPEQNNAFHDNYLDVDYDLSKVLFIATANDLNTIPRPLLDRMEIIEVSGYITEEKIEIAKRHLVPKELKNTGLDSHTPRVKFNKAALDFMIERYTRESGVRQLEKQINKALRKLVYEEEVKGTIVNTNIDPTRVEALLGKAPFYHDIYQGNNDAGVVTGLAWTSVGGEILFIETSLNQGRGGKLTLTGNLGDVMKESAMIALQYVKAHVAQLNIDYRLFDYWNIHIHVPEGATPKDGPSAGITIATSIASAITQRKVHKNLAMTGEITLRGKVLPVGGIKEKILAAKRAGITDIVMCKDNQKDVEEIPAKYLEGLTFHYVDTILEVWDIALTDERVENAVAFTIPDEKEEKK